MASRMKRAHLRALHTTACGMGETSFERATKKHGCKCQPRYRVQFRDDDGRWVRETTGRDRKDAQTRLAEIQSELGRGTWERPAEDVTFSAWADEWFTALARPKENTLRDYKTTIKYGKAVFGNKPLRSIQHADLKRFLDSLKRTTTGKDGKPVTVEATATTKRKHMRVLSAMFKAATERRPPLIASNPVKGLPELPQATTHRAAWFEDDELARLTPEIPEGLYRTMFVLSYKTGLRSGELIALTWGDLELLDEPHIRIRRTYVEGLGLQDTPKSKAGSRDVFVTPDVVELLGAWLRECGNPAPDVLIFPGAGQGGFVRGSFLSRGILYPALERAGIDRLHQATGTERTWHSLRHTYARMAIEGGITLKQLQEQMGHESWAVTDRVYSHISPKARAAAVGALKFV